MVSLPQSKYRPNAAATEVYRRLYEVYLTLHDAFGRRGNADVYHVMKTLNAIRREASRG
jgi:L-ribulokinase